MSRREEGGFLDRWSARKRAAREADELQDAPPVRVEPPVEKGPPTLTEEEAAGLTDAEALERLALPDPASLERGGDFKAFLREGVPMRLRRMALRRLWAVTPGGAALDGLIEYGEDYSDAAVAVQALATSYEVGKGLRAHTEALAAEEEAKAGAEALAEETPPDDAAASEPSPEREPETDGVNERDSSETKTAALSEQNDQEINAKSDEPVQDWIASNPVENVAETGFAAAKRPRKMAFRFKDD